MLNLYKYYKGPVTFYDYTDVDIFIPNSFLIQSLILIIHIFLGFYFCYSFTCYSNDKDPGYIVIDEVVGMMIALFLLPKVFEVYIISFILFRLLDILKPSIIERSQHFSFGIGIMLDDIIAGLIVLLIMNGLYVL